MDYSAHRGTIMVNGPRYNQLPFGEAAFNALLYNYKRKAKSRNLVFDLTIDVFRLLTKQVCKYCGREPHRINKVNKRVGEYVYNGVDRVDNSQGYTAENVVACCYDCNRMKHALGETEFLTHVERIHTWQRK